MPALQIRRGITLMEVLISIGILSVGLTSVVSLVPAGQSQAARAVILDRAAAAVANGLHDAVTFGLTKPEAVAFDVPGGGPVWVFDPVVQRNPGALTGTYYLNAVGARLKPSGVYSQTSSADGTVDWRLLQLVGEGRDDLVFPAGAGADDPPRNAYDASGLRPFNGRMTCVFSVARADNLLTTSPGPGDVAKLTVVAFHNRDLRNPDDGFRKFRYDPARSTLTPVGALPANRTLRDVIRPGVVIYDPNKITAGFQYQRFSQVQMASVDTEAVGGPVVYVTFSSPAPTGSEVTVLLDSVGLAEQMVVLEGPGPYSK